MARSLETELARLARKVRARAIARFPQAGGSSAPPRLSLGDRLAMLWRRLRAVIARR